jgi:NAD(P)-dependent dehydrogenase (short-subunit alcohol dehydrogenase family)
VQLAKLLAQIHAVSSLDDRRRNKVDREDSERQRAIFITGAASGIGRATAELFASRGWFVGGFDVNRNALAALSEALGSGAGLFRPLDVTDRAAVLAAVERFGRATGGKLDLLFNNAGIDAKGPFESMPWEKIVAVVNVNLLAGMSLIHAAIPLPARHARTRSASRPRPRRRSSAPRASRSTRRPNTR